MNRNFINYDCLYVHTLEKKKERGWFSFFCGIIIIVIIITNQLNRKAIYEQGS